MSNFVDDEESKLQKLKDERDTIERRPHDGFADAVHVTRLNSEIEALEESILQTKQHPVQGQG